MLGGCGVFFDQKDWIVACLQDLRVTVCPGVRRIFAETFDYSEFLCALERPFAEKDLTVAKL
jgi:hypothetical protein